MPSVDKQEMIERLVVGVARSKSGVTVADIRKAVTILFQTQLFNITGDSKHDTRVLKFKQDPKYFEKVDMALLQRLYAVCVEAGVVIDQEVVQTERTKEKILRGYSCKLLNLPKNRLKNVRILKLGVGSTSTAANIG